MPVRIRISLLAILVVTGCGAKKPQPDAPVATAAVTVEAGNPPPSSGVVVASMTQEFRRCWETERASANPPQSAAGTVTLKVEPNGTVSSATAAGIDRPSLVACIEGVGKSTKFAPVDPPGATMIIPVNL